MESQTKTSCCQCQSAKAPHTCGGCAEALCKSCALFVGEENYLYLNTRPEILKHSVFCTPCYNSLVAPVLADYETTVQKAREVLVFDKTQGKETRFVKRLEKPVKIAQGLDEQDITMRLAFMAAEKNYNSIIDVDIKATKVRDGSYQTTVYSGSAIPANVSDRKLLKDRSFWSDPN